MWYATGRMRWSAIEEKKGLRIYSWSPVDALQLMQQHYQKPQQTEGDVEEDRASVSRRIAHTDVIHEPCLELNVPSMGSKALSATCKNCWGSPPEDQLLSPKAWGDLLDGVAHELRIRTDRLLVKCDASCSISVKGLLDALLVEDNQDHVKDMLMEQEGGLRCIEVQNGTFDSSNLFEWVCSLTQQKLFDVKLSSIACNISPDGISSVPEGKKTGAHKVKLDCEIK